VGTINDGAATTTKKTVVEEEVIVVCATYIEAEDIIESRYLRGETIGVMTRELSRFIKGGDPHLCQRRRSSPDYDGIKLTPKLD
ncbi:DNA topoisomerase 2-alpha, partial [Sesbania bispinosa]